MVYIFYTRFFGGVHPLAVVVHPPKKRYKEKKFSFKLYINPIKTPIFKFIFQELFKNVILRSVINQQKYMGYLNPIPAGVLENQDTLPLNFLFDIQI